MADARRRRRPKRSRRARPSSQSGSYSAVWISAGGKPRKSRACAARPSGRRAQSGNPIVLPIANHRPLFEKMADAELSPRIRSPERIHHRTKQDLQGDGQPACSRELADDDRQIAARGISRDADARGIKANALGLRDRNLHGAHAIFDARGERMFRREAISDGDDAACADPASARQIASCDRKLARKPAAAMKIDEPGQGSRRRRRWRVDADRNRAAIEGVVTRIDGGALAGIGEGRQRIRLLRASRRATARPSDL